MKLHELWTVTNEWEDDQGTLFVEGKTSDNEAPKKYIVIKDPKTNKGQWEILQISQYLNF